MKPFFPLFTWGAEGPASVETQGPQWVWRASAIPIRVFPPRVRDDVWVEEGHLRDPNPDLDTTGDFR